MNCKTCGMDSKTAGTCSWCGASLASPEDAPTEVKPERARPVTREPLEGEEGADEEVQIGSVSSLQSLLEARAGTPTEASPPVPLDPLPTTPKAPKVTTARKVAPALPGIGSKARTPAPAVPPPSSRAASATGKLPPLETVPNAPLPPNPVRTPVASLQDQADALFMTGGASGASAVDEPMPLKAESAPLASERPPVADLATPSTPVPPALASPLPTPNTLAERPAPVSLLTGEAVVTAREPETAIGSGVTPATAKTSAPAAKPSVTEQQKLAAVKVALADDMQSIREALIRYVAVFGVIVIVVGVCAHLLPRFYVVPMVIGMFVAAMLLPILRVTPWVEEDGEDVAWFIGLTLLFGPLVGLIVYAVVAAFRQSFNASILGALAVAAVLRLTAEEATGLTNVGLLLTTTSPFAGLQHIDTGILKQLLLNWSGFAALAGWYAASSFHKEDE